MRISRLLFLPLLLIATAGCAVKSNYMQTAETAPEKISPDQATLIFIRPSLYGGAIQASLYEVDEKSIEFIGISSAKTKIAYHMNPGEHRFMVVGESADYMDATVEAGKTYYAVVSPRMGFWKARFSLYPVRVRNGKFNHTSAEFKQWLRETDWVVTTPAAERWYQSNSADVARKHRDYLPKWLASTSAERVEATLHANDAVD